jgi:tRNA pseudouridine38/39 synthase
MKKLRLIEHRRSCNYSRCGRTDRGVSAFGQVVAMRVRSAIPLSVADADVPRDPWAAVVDPATGKSHIEMNYVRVLNHSLPDTIRVLGWCEVTPDFSARFSCGTRTYRYFFQRRRLDVAAMNDAAGRLVGEHDFRNLAKLDVANVSNFVRVIQYARVERVMGSDGRGDKQVMATATATATSEGEGEGDLFKLEIRGVAFLWHQVRNIMAVLTMVGEGKEHPAVIDALFDISSCPACPDYMMADERPLVLHHCEVSPTLTPYCTALLTTSSASVIALSPSY